MSEKEKLMTLLNVSEAEALDIMAYDKKVESGKATEYDLTEEQKKVASDMAKTGTRVYNFSKKRDFFRHIIRYKMMCLIFFRFLILRIFQKSETS